MKCPTCQTNPAIKHPFYGFLDCDSCREKKANLPKPGALPEFTSESIKTQRKEYARDITPVHNRGQLSKEWLDSEWGGAKRAKQAGFSDKEIKEAKFTWNSEKYYSEH